MTIEIGPEQEHTIGLAIQAGIIRTAADGLDAGMETIRRQLEARQDVRPADAKQWSRELHAWVQSHSTETPLLSEVAISRESIYGNRGM